MSNSILDFLSEEQINFNKEYMHILPVLYGLACYGDKNTIHVEIAKVLELMKSSTLILDDFLDKSDTRNGVASIYKMSGAENAVLTAEIIKSTATIKLTELLREFPIDMALQVICIFEETYRTICMGQLEDNKLESSKLDESFPSEEDSINTIMHTTAIFIQLPLIMGAILSKKNNDTIHKLANYGINIGLAYQLRDDILDIIAETEITGKPENGDLLNRKKKLPIILLRDKLPEKELIKLLNIYNTRKQLSKRNIAWIKRLMIEYNVITECKKRINNYCYIALNGLKELDLDEEYYKKFELLTKLLINFDAFE